MYIESGRVKKQFVLDILVCDHFFLGLHRWS